MSASFCFPPGEFSLANPAFVRIGDGVVRRRYTSAVTPFLALG